MKKYILTLAAITLMVFSGKAQDDESIIHLGLKAGLNLSNIYDTDGNDFDTDPKLGVAAGAFLSIPLGRFLGIQPEILFSQRGFKSKGIVAENGYELTRTTSYIDVPLLLAIKPVKYVTILAGPQISFLTNSKDEFSNSSISFEQEQEFRNSNLRKNTVCFTGGVDINVSRLVLSARAGWDIQNNDGDGTSTNPRYKNVWYQATVGFRIF